MTPETRTPSTATVTDATHGHPVAHIAHDLRVGPPTIIRWIRRGRRIQDGTRVYLAATALPGGYRVTDEALAEFVSALTADRLGDRQAAPTTTRTSSQARRQHEQAMRDLTAAGF